MPTKDCSHCSKPFYCKPCHMLATRKRFCSRKCQNAALVGVHMENGGTFKKGRESDRKSAIGDVRIRQRKNRPEGARAWVKVANPNVWRLRAVVVWESTNGPVPSGFVVHHQNRDTLDDVLSNLKLESRAEHLEEHRREHHKNPLANSAAMDARREIRVCACGEEFATIDRRGAATACRRCRARDEQRRRRDRAKKPALPPATDRVCPACGERHPLDAAHWYLSQRNGRDRVSTLCRPCTIQKVCKHRDHAGRG